MAKQRNALRTGIFMVVSVALVVVVVLGISGTGRFTESFQTYPVIFGLGDNIGGLRVGDDVRIGGLKVGSVRDIRIESVKPSPAEEQTPMVLVAVDVPRKYHIYRNAEVLVQRGLTGEPAINFESLGSGEVLAASDHLSGRPDPFAALTHQLASAGPDLRQTVANLRVTSENLRESSPQIRADLEKFGRTADTFAETGREATATVMELRQRLPEIIQRYQQVSGAAIDALDAVRDMIGPSSGDFHNTVANLSAATATIRYRLPGLVDQVASIMAKLDNTMDHAGAAVADIERTMRNAKELTGTVRSLLVDNKSKFDSMIASFKSTSDNLKYASAEIRHSPWRLLYQPKPGEVANMEIYDSMRQFAEGADDLDDAAGSLRDAVKDKEADPAKVQKLLEHLEETFGHFQQVQKKLWEQVQE